MGAVVRRADSGVHGRLGSNAVRDPRPVGSPRGTSVLQFNLRDSVTNLDRGKGGD